LFVLLSAHDEIIALRRNCICNFVATIVTYSKSVFRSGVGQVFDISRQIIPHCFDLFESASMMALRMSPSPDAASLRAPRFFFSSGLNGTTLNGASHFSSRD
ncbi:MAG TPA: hypothetical protein VK117_09560, partial [Pyrinomonadaceae bacterium]|nr:hypothetical protein [Pyrinomonadaceae bacterium]